MCCIKYFEIENLKLQGDGIIFHDYIGKIWYRDIQYRHINLCVAFFANSILYIHLHISNYIRSILNLCEYIISIYIIQVSNMLLMNIRSRQLIFAKSTLVIPTYISYLLDCFQTIQLQQLRAAMHRWWSLKNDPYIREKFLQICLNIFVNNCTYRDQ